MKMKLMEGEQEEEYPFSLLLSARAGGDVVKNLLRAEVCYTPRFIWRNTTTVCVLWFMPLLCLLFGCLNRSCRGNDN